MNEKPSDSSLPLLSEADQLRFEEDLPQWLAGHLPPEQAQWMTQMQERHVSLASQVEWLSDMRTVLRTEAAQEDTHEAWALLSHKLIHAQEVPTSDHISSEPGASSEPSGPRWLKWLQIHPAWANVVAAAAVVLIVGQAGWIVTRPDPHTNSAGWRSLDIDDMRGMPASAASATHIQLQLRPSVSLAEMASVKTAVEGQTMSAEVSWRPLSANVWVVQVEPAVKDEQALVDRLKILPFVEQARPLPQR